MIHYFGSRHALLRESAVALRGTRAAEWREALAAADVSALDLLWERLAAAADDGSGRACLELRFAGIAEARLTTAEADAITAALARVLEVTPAELPIPAAIEPILEGYLIALMGGAEPEGVREAFFRYWLTYVK